MIDINDDTNRVRGRVEIRAGIIRRRHWSDEDKWQIVAEAIAPEAVTAEVALHHNMTPQHLSNWIRVAAMQQVMSEFVDEREVDAARRRYRAVVEDRPSLLASRRRIPRMRERCI